MTSTIKTGDLLGFSGVGFQSRVIQATTFSWIRQINHVAIVRQGAEGMEVWESTQSLRMVCQECEEQHDGVQMHHLAGRMLHAKANAQIVWHYALREPLSDSAIRRLENRLFQSHGLPYDYWGAVWARSCAFGWLAHRLRNRESLGNLFCSEFVAVSERDAGVFNTPNASMWNPAFLLRTFEYLGIVDSPRLFIEGRAAA